MNDFTRKWHSCALTSGETLGALQFSDKIRMIFTTWFEVIESIVFRLGKPNLNWFKSLSQLKNATKTYPPEFQRDDNQLDLIRLKKNSSTS